MYESVKTDVSVWNRDKENLYVCRSSVLSRLGISDSRSVSLGAGPGGKDANAGDRGEPANGPFGEYLA